MGSVLRNLMLFHNTVRTYQNENLISTGFRFRGRLNATWQLPRNLALEFFGFYRSGGKIYKARASILHIKFFRKLFWDKNGSIGFTATNLFSMDIKQVSTTATVNSVSKSVRMLPFRSFGVTFTYKFGKMQKQKHEKDEEPESPGNGNEQ